MASQTYKRGEKGEMPAFQEMEVLCTGILDTTAAFDEEP